MRYVKFIALPYDDGKLMRIAGYDPNEPRELFQGFPTFLAVTDTPAMEYFIITKLDTDTARAARPDEYANLKQFMQLGDHTLRVVGEIEPPRVIEILPFSDDDLKSGLNGFAIQAVAIVDGVTEEYVTDDKADFWEVYVVRDSEHALLAARCPSRDDAESVYFLLKSVRVMAEKALLDRIK